MNQLGKENYEHLHIVLGVVNDKNLEEVLPLFPVKASYYFAKPAIPRGLDAEELKKNSEKFKLEGEVYSSVQNAYLSANEKAKRNDLIYVGGSTFTVAEII